MIKLLVDGIFFQITNTGIARVWRSVLGLLAEDPRFEIYILDRGRAPEIVGAIYIPFPSNRFSDTAADSLLIQQVCDFYGIDVFTSTYYTTPVSTPMVLMVYDMIPELFGFDLSLRGWMEKGVAISYAQAYVCISHNTRKDLLACYPEIAAQRATVAHCGLDETVFYPRDEGAIVAFRKRFGLERPYFLFVGSRVQHNGYKNSQLFFDAIAGMRESRFDVFCVGGEVEIESGILQALPKGVQCRRVELSDEELAHAYGGALALVYPSLYEGFGMPVIEAMACGCPVITTHHGSLAEAAGDAAHLIGGRSVEEMRDALERVQEAAYRHALSEKGIAYARKFRWGDMARAFGDEADRLAARAKTGIYEAFFARWRQLRELQASVDFPY